MQALFLLCVGLGVASAFVFHDNYVSKKIKVTSNYYYPLFELPEDAVQFDDPPRIITAEYSTPLDHFNDLDTRRLRMV